MFRLLPLREEATLTPSALQQYYTDLRSYALNRKLTNTTPGALTVAPKLKGITNKIADKLARLLCRSKVEILSDGQENIPEGGVRQGRQSSLHLPIRDCWTTLSGYRLHRSIVSSYILLR